MNEDALIKRIDALLEETDGTVTIAIDGRCAAGKSLLGERLARRYGCRLFHADDYFLPPYMRTEARLKEPGGNIHRERFKAEVIDRLDGDITCRRFDCRANELLEPVQMPYTRLNIVEGAYCTHPCFGEPYALKVFMTVDKQTQSERILKRNGEKRHKLFVERWIPLEEAYFSALSVQERCDVTLALI